MVSSACLRFIAQSSTYSAVCSFNIPPGAHDGFVGFPRFNASDRATERPCETVACQEKPTSRRGATDPPFPALYRAAAACPALPRLRPMVSREEGVFNISMGGGFLDRPGACRNVGNPGRSVPRFRQVEGFSALSMAGGFLARPAGCWKGGKAAPESPFPQRPRAFTPPAGQFQKSQRKRAPSRIP